MRRILSLLIALPLLADEPGKGLKVHEWGVFVVGENEAQAAAGGAPLEFIRRVEMPDQDLRRGGGGDAGPALPILHVYAASPVRLKVEVAFSQGGPTLAWPEPALSWTLKEGSKGSLWPTLTWEVQAGGKNGPEPPEVPRDHWVDTLRKLGASRLTMADGMAAEDFLFYEGRVSNFRNLVRLEAATEGQAILKSAGVPEAWYVLSDGKALRVCRATRMTGSESEALRTLESAAFQVELAGSLVKAGLTQKEAEALLGIWMGEFTKPGKRILYLLPRGEYDRMLPICITPKPEETVRVGLVLEEVGA